MIENSMLIDIAMEWLVLTNEEKKDIKQKTEKLRKEVKLKWKDGLISSMSAFWGDSRGIAIELDSYYGHADEADGTAYAIELACLQEMLSPRSLAWEQTCQHLTNALNDAVIQKDNVAIAFIEEMLSVATEFDILDDEDLFSSIKSEGIKVYKSLKASNAAKSKNAKPRAWVISKWETRIDKGQSKSSFAQQYALLVKSKFDLLVTPSTIERGWLPKGKM